MQAFVHNNTVLVYLKGINFCKTTCCGISFCELFYTVQVFRCFGVFLMIFKTGKECTNNKKFLDVNVSLDKFEIRYFCPVT